MTVFKQQHYIDYDAPAQQQSPTSVAAAKAQTKTAKIRTPLDVLGEV